MKKSLLIVSMLFASAFSIQAQNIQLNDLNDNNVTNTTINAWVDTSSLDPYEYDLNVINTTPNAVSVNCARVLNDILPSSESYFCWDQCYSSIVDLAQPITINAFDTIVGFFHAYFNPYHQVGISTIKFQFFNTANTNDTSNITIVLDSNPLGIKNIGLSAKNKISSAYPNPASGFTAINYAVESANNSTLKITDELGQVVYDKTLENTKGTVKITTSEFKPGIYFYSLNVGNTRVSTKKLVITQ